ncbi:MAG: 1-deoxy-D-xylulose-5-phosphate synthase [Solobacterium sp.]|jgi:1-deoxy-D-xylulose-5-phosphate synthase|nr:1-deoxy-D-xylulose-5-phosphate synthase [Solobacterium sp.]MCH4223184.1 1-deoxy-D-xylulose-5-phosphate synthase [Solobacterium sp.]MCH4266032.1 1-deoxy-D-xylulose-5-phosphate synthase [Solobacterium sp.]
MDLTKIQNPEFLKTMTVPEMNELAQEIRVFLINNISKTGGHLASNLGVVELTIALHYVFNSPEDKIFFDVGHQSYTHKILTGRAKDFPMLRQYEGLSGFEKRRESEHDVWEAGHSSTSLSAALGMAVARDLNHEHYDVVPVIGDGALGSGMSMEALNQIGSEKRKLIIIFNDNNMSISKNVGALTMGFAKMRAAKTYNELKSNMKTSLSKNEFGKVMYRGLKNFKDGIKEQVIDTGIFGDFNLEYMGPVDGHNIRNLIRVLTVAKEHDGPVVVHVMTQKGRGYTPCERDTSGRWHGVGPFDVATGTSLHETPEGYKSWSKAIADDLEDEADHNDDIIAITPAMITGSALEHFFAKYPDRSFDCGIAEEHAATFAAGLAVSGKRPFLSIYSSFLQRAYDQINHDICRMDLPVVIGIDRAGLVGGDGETHHGVFDIGLLKPIPNIILSQPKDAQEARDLMAAAFAQPHPFAIRYPKGEIPCPEHLTPNPVKIGSWPVYHDDSDNKVIVLSYGPEVDKILDKVTINKLPVTVVNCRFFKPIDTDLIQQIAKRNLPVIVYETDMKEGGVAASILEYLSDHRIELNLTRFGIGDEYMMQGANNQLRKSIGDDLNSLFEEINSHLQ